MDRKMLRKFPCFLFLLTGLGPVALADDPGLFFGHWQGSGYAENADSIYFATTPRDLDVEIMPADNGAFSIRTTTVTYDSGDPADPKVQTKQSLIVFEKTDNPSVYKARSGGDPMRGNALWWSRIDENSLYTYMVRIESDGRWQVQNYTRRLSGSGMELEFTRQRDGQKTRTVRGKLIKIK